MLYSAIFITIIFLLTKSALVMKLINYLDFCYFYLFFKLFVETEDDFIEENTCIF